MGLFLYLKIPFHYHCWEGMCHGIAGSFSKCKWYPGTGSLLLFIKTSGKNESTCVSTGRNEVDLAVEVRLGQEEKGVGLGAPQDTLIQGKPELNHLNGGARAVLSCLGLRFEPLEHHHPSSLNKFRFQNVYMYRIDSQYLLGIRLAIKWIKRGQEFCQGFRDSLKLNVKYFVSTTRGQYYPIKCLHPKVPSCKLSGPPTTTRVSHLYQ